MNLLINLVKLWSIIIHNRVRKFQILLLFTLILFSSFFELFSIGIFLPFLSVLTSPENLFIQYNKYFSLSFLEIQTAKDLLFPTTILFIVAVVISGIFRTVLLWYQTKLSFSIGTELSSNVYKRTLYQPYMVHISQNSSDIISAITNKVSGVIFNILVPLPSLLASIVLLIVILSSLLYINTIVALSSFISFSVIYLFIILFTRKNLVKAGLSANIQNTNVIKTLQEGLGGIRDVLIDGSQETLCEIYKNADSQLRNSQAKITYISSSPRFSIEMFALVLMATFAYKLSNNSNGISSPIPLLGTLALGAQRILPILQQIYVGYTNIKGGESFLKDVLILLDQPLPETYGNSEKVLQFNEKICLDKVYFSYSNNSTVLKDINLNINKGSKVGIFGKTGGGKSTILDILMGLLPATSGRLYIDDIVIDDSNITLWQKHIAHVPQFIFLSDSTIAENIAFGIPPDQIDYNKLKVSADKAQLLETIELMPNGFTTSVGERGISLSGGQRQRIGIARAIYKQADVIIFDEATSALDSETENEIMNEIYNLDENLTIIIVAHRLSTLKNCDRFFEIQNKKIIEHSSFDDVLLSHLN